MRRGVNERRRFENKRTNLFFPRNNCTDQTLRARHTNLDQEKPERQRQENAGHAGRRDDMDRQGGRKGVKEKLFIFFFLLPKCKQGCLFIPNFSHAHFSFLSLAWSKGWMGELRVCVCVACDGRGGERNGWMVMLGSLCTILLGVHFDALVLAVLCFVILPVLGDDVTVLSCECLIRSDGWS
jgi:hypothetical protein